MPAQNAAGMRHLFRPCSLFLAFLLVLGGAGCAGEGMGHLSGQLGVFYGEGVSFSVPLVKLSTTPGQQDQYWELRQGIDHTVVVAFAPLTGGGDPFRENMVVTAQDLPSATTPHQFRELQLGELKKEGQIQGEPTLGEDRTGPWAQYTTTANGATVSTKAWFFVSPGEKPRGFVLVGSAAQTGDAETWFRQFQEVAESFRFGPPPSGFALLGRAVEAVAGAAE